MRAARPRVAMRKCAHEVDWLSCIASLHPPETFVNTSPVDQALGALRAGDAAAAIRAIHSAPAATRNTPVALRTLAAAHAQLGDLLAADEAIQRALTYTPVEPATRALAGRIALDAGQHTAALSHFEALGPLLLQQPRLLRYLWDCAVTPALRRRALHVTQAAGADAAADVAVSWAASRALLDSGQINAALALVEETVARHPGNTSALWLQARRRVDETPLAALAVLGDSVLTDPLDADAVDTALILPEHYADDASVTAWRARYERGLQALQRRLPDVSDDPDARAQLVRHTAFLLAYHGRDDRSLQGLRGDVLARLMQPLAASVRGEDRFDQNPVDTRPQLRVGFVSKHVRDCTVGQYFKRFFTDLGDKDIEVRVYACGTRDAFTDEVATRTTLQHVADDANALRHMAQAIVRDAPDVLIYPEIGMEPIIEKLAAMRLAPLQCALWGHPATTGLPTIDVFLSAAALEPPDAATHYRERLHALPGLGTGYPTPPAPSALSRRELGLAETGTLLLCAQSPFKWNPSFTRAVGAVLAAAPAARLIVFDSPDAGRSRVFDNYLAHHFSPLGIRVAERVVRLPQRGRADFLAALAQSDLALDSFGFSGGNTSLDALSVGLPVLTLPGQFMRGRQTMAMLRTLGAAVSTALIANDEADYVRRAVALAGDAAARQRLREQINATNAGLFNDPAPAAALRRWLLQATGRSS